MPLPPSTTTFSGRTLSGSMKRMAASWNSSLTSTSSNDPPPAPPSSPAPGGRGALGAPVRGTPPLVARRGRGASRGSALNARGGTRRGAHPRAPPPRGAPRPPPRGGEGPPPAGARAGRPQAAGGDRG